VEFGVGKQCLSWTATNRQTGSRRPIELGSDNIPKEELPRFVETSMKHKLLSKPALLESILG
jgi:hypothetical protein